jgi:Ion channel
MWVWTTLGGFAIVGFTLREMFHDLFHPTESGSLSDSIATALFALLRRRRSMLPLAGPIALATIITSWALLIVLGFSLVYWSWLSTNFQLTSGNNPEIDHGFPAAFYFSLEVMTTLGLGEFIPQPPWLRLIVGLHCLMGFGLVTASVSWIVLLYPALGRMRTLARRTAIVAAASEWSGVDAVSGDAQSMLSELALDLIRVRVDLVHFPIIYYFHSESRRAALSHAIPLLVAFADAGCRPDRPERVRLAAAALRIALDDLACLFAERFLDVDGEDPAAVFAAYRKHHLAID